MLFISGGSQDFNLTHMAKVCADQGRLSLTLYIDQPDTWQVKWDLDNANLYINGEEVKPSALFVRWDVFSLIKDSNVSSDHLNNWFDFIKGWAFCNPDVKILNRLFEDYYANKPYTLKLAKESGLEIPETLFTNDISAVSKDNKIIKPVAGGAHTQDLDADISTVSPSIIQEKLINPELRLYRIGNDFFAFRISSAALDYRALDMGDVEIVQVTPPENLVQGLRKLTDILQLDYAAADFKTCAKTGRYKFLEVNSMPMFAGFDQFADNALTKSIVNYLMS
mgnify:CR=1 FL=1